MKNYKVLSNVALTKSVYKMVLEGDTSTIKKPGQFVNILIPNHYLRRPISISQYDQHTITILYKVVGQGTKTLSTLSTGMMLDCLVGLGNGYDTNVDFKHGVLIGGGIGIPPLIQLEKELLKQGKRVTVILGFNQADEIFGLDSFQNKPLVCTVDGSYGIKGFVTDILKTLDVDYLFTCGPLPMFKALSQFNLNGQYSFEARMGCGYGACMGCSLKVKDGYKRICKEGPVFEKGEILWESI